MRRAFICWRPYQVFNSVVYLMNNIDERSTNDLYIEDTKKLNDIVPKLMQTHLFNNIFLFKEVGQGSKIRITLENTSAYLWPQKYVRQHIVKKVNQDFSDEGVDSYDEVYATGWLRFFVAFCEMNSNAQVNFLEDGVGTYIGTDNPKTNASTFNRIFYKLFRKGKLSVNISKLYVYYPELVSEGIAREIIKMPEIMDEAFQMLKLIFGESGLNLNNGKNFILLQQPPVEESQEYDIKLQGVMAEILKYRDKLVIREHPAYKTRHISGVEYDESGSMWELVSRNLNEHTCLVSVISTAMLSPRLLYGRRLPCIFLYRMILGNKSDRIKMDSFLRKMPKELKKNIYIPESIEELAKIMNYFSNNNK